MRSYENIKIDFSIRDDIKGLNDHLFFFFLPPPASFHAKWEFWMYFTALSILICIYSYNNNDNYSSLLFKKFISLLFFSRYLLLFLFLVSLPEIFKFLDCFIDLLVDILIVFSELLILFFSFVAQFSYFVFYFVSFALQVFLQLFMNEMLGWDDCADIC